MRLLFHLALVTATLLVGGPMLYGQCTPPPKRTLLIAADAGAGRDTIFFGHHPLATRGQDTMLCERELPPPPPTAVFDFRFVNPPGYEGTQPPAGMGQGFYFDYRAQTSPVQIDTHRVRIQTGSGGYPVTFSWLPAGIAAIVDSARLIDEFGGTIVDVPMLGTASVVVTNPAVGTLLLISYGTLEVPSTPVLLSPADGSSGVLPAAAFSWAPATQARTYRLQVGEDSLLTSPLYDDSTLTSTGGTAGTLSAGTRYFWRVRAANGAGNGAWSAVWDFTTLTVPAAPLLVSPADGADRRPVMPLLVWNTAAGADAYRVQAGVDSTFGSPLVDSSGVIATFMTTPPLAAGTEYVWRVQGLNGAGAGPWSTVWRFTTVPELTFPFFLQPGWNMLSLPIAPPDRRVQVLFPEALSRAYAFEPSGYVQRDTLLNGRGYWVKFPASDTAGVTGILQVESTVQLMPGWNLFGTIGDPVAVTAIGQSPPGVVASPFYGFSATYTTADTLRPGQAYWVKASGAGTLTIPAGSIPGN